MMKNLSLIFFGKAPNRQAKAIQDAQNLSVTPSVAANRGDANSDEALLPVLDADCLLKPHAALIFEISELAGVSADAFQPLYRAAINAFARYVQQLPASAVHHHAGLGGLLEHSLEVCVLALRIRRSYLFSAQHGAEEIAKKQDLWTYAVFMAALCHDLAKPVLQQRIELTAKTSGGVKLWQPLAGDMKGQGGGHYRTVFVHSGGIKPALKLNAPSVTPLLMQYVIPKQGLQWLGSDWAVFAQWLAAISGGQIHRGEIMEIIVAADSQSVSRNLGGGAFEAAAKPKPLVEKILTALRHLLENGELSIDKDQGDDVWVKGDDVWLASKAVGDKLCAQLILENHPDAPALNGQLFEVLQTHGVLVPCGEKALWQVTVAGEGWQQNITALRMPVSKLWVNPASRPLDFTGEVLLEAPQSTLLTPAATPRDNPIPASLIDTNGAESALGEWGGFLPSMAVTPEPDQIIEAVTDQIEALTQNLEKNNQPLTQAAEQMAEGTMPSPTEEAAGLQTINRPPVVFTPPVNPKARLPENTVKQEAAHTNGAVNDFIAWLLLMVKTGAMPMNSSDALVHVVAEGVLLVTPNIFKGYAQGNGLEDWIPTQKALLKKGWHVKSSGSNISTYQVTGKEKSSTVNGLLFANPTVIFGGSKLPKPNPHLTCNP